MATTALLEKYFSEQHSLLKAIVDRYHQSKVSKKDFVNYFITSAGVVNNKINSRFHSDVVISETKKLNQYISWLKNIRFLNIHFNDDLELGYVFTIQLNQDDENSCVDILYIRSAHSIAPFVSQTFNNLSDDEVQVLLTLVQQQISFGLLKQG